MLDQTASLTPEQVLLQELAENVENQQRLKAEVKDLEEIITAHADEIKARLIALQQSEVVVNTNRGVYKLTYNPFAERESLDKTLLVEAGVTTEQLKRATKTTQYVRLDVREVKQR